MNEPKTDRTPLMLSAFVYPGAGQFIQRRWIAGTLYAVFFTVFFVLFMVNVARPMMANVDAALAFAMGDGSKPMTAPSLVAIIVPFVLSMLAYVANIIDASRAQRRTAKPPPLPP